MEVIDQPVYKEVNSAVGIVDNAVNKFLLCHSNMPFRHAANEVLLVHSDAPENSCKVGQKKLLNSDVRNDRSKIGDVLGQKRYFCVMLASWAMYIYAL